MWSIASHVKHYSTHAKHIAIFLYLQTHRLLGMEKNIIEKIIKIRQSEYTDIIDKKQYL